MDDRSGQRGGGDTSGGLDTDGAGTGGMVRRKDAGGDMDEPRGRGGGEDTDGRGTSGILGGRDAGAEAHPPGNSASADGADTDGPGTRGMVAEKLDVEADEEEEGGPSTAL